MNETVTLYRPIGQQELELIRQSAFAKFPPRLPEQPIFYPVLNELYAVQIARDWNAKHNTPKRGYVTRFAVNANYLRLYEVKTVGASMHKEYWIPAEALDEFNRNIVGKIEVTHEFSGEIKS